MRRELAELGLVPGVRLVVPAAIIVDKPIAVLVAGQERQVPWTMAQSVLVVVA